MINKTLRMIAIVMMLFAIVFVWYALNHPEASFPLSNSITFVFYGVYVGIMLFFIVASFKKR